MAVLRVSTFSDYDTGILTLEGSHPNGAALFSNSEAFSDFPALAVLLGAVALAVPAAAMGEQGVSFILGCFGLSDTSKAPRHSDSQDVLICSF